MEKNSGQYLIISSTRTTLGEGNKHGSKKNKIIIVVTVRISRPTMPIPIPITGAIIRVIKIPTVIRKKAINESIVTRVRR